jgi:hypothetical protein
MLCGDVLCVGMNMTSQQKGHLLKISMVNGIALSVMLQKMHLRKYRNKHDAFIFRSYEFGA